MTTDPEPQALPNNNDSGYSDKKVVAHLHRDKELTTQEQDVALSAWLRAYSERKSKQAATLSILAAALALTAGVASSGELPFGIVYVTVGLIVVVAGYFIAQILLGRDREAIEAAAAVLGHRASNPK